METRILMRKDVKWNEVIRYVEIVVNVFDFDTPITFYYIGDLYDLLADIKFRNLEIEKEIAEITILSVNEFEIISLNQRGEW